MTRRVEQVGPATLLMAVPPTSEEKLELVRRVGASASFERSPRLRELLLYICEQAIQGHPQELKEQVIGRRVFGRAPDYSSADDNIVRVEARQLRKRLEEYFAGEGKAEPTVIVIPKGGYLPSFEPREAPSTETPLTVAPVPEVPRPSHKQWLAIALATLLALAAVWLLLPLPLHWDRTISTASQPPQRGPLWPLLFDGHQQTMIVCADSALVMAQKITQGPISLDQYVQREYDKSNSHLTAADSVLLRTLQGEQFTDIADVRLVQRMAHLNANQWDRAVVRSARTVELQDFKTGNIILLGSSRSNPWDLLFEPQQNFRFGFNYDPADRYAYVQNMAPQPGEQPIYRGAGPGQPGYVFATITLVPDLRHYGKVLIIAGTTAEGTETAGEFITDREASAGLIRTLLERNKGKIPYFEVLLRSGAFAGVAQRTEVIALRVLAGQ